MPERGGDLTAYVPRLLLEWEADQPDESYRRIDGTLVFADVSGFTRLSERLASAGGKRGAEQMTDVINALFGDLLLVAAGRGGEMLKYGGDAVLLFFTGDEHAPRGAAAAIEMQRKLREIGRVQAGTGFVRLRMSVGVNSGAFDLFKVGGLHDELVIAGPATTECVRMEAEADAREVLVSAATAALVGDAVLGDAKAGGRLLRRAPKAPVVDFQPFRTKVDAARFLAAGLRVHLGSGAVEPDHRLATIAFVQAMDLDRRLAVNDGCAVAEELAATLATIQESFEHFGVSFLATDLAADGVKVMAASGAPVAREDAEERMIGALRRVVEAGTPLPVRAGVNRGHVFAGDVGPPFRRTYTTIGDVTNTAARVMGQAKQGEVLALGPVVERLRAVYDCATLEPFVAKGKAEPLTPISVGARRAEQAVRERVPLVGRDGELQWLLGLVAEADDGRGGSAELLGEPGIGKSRLVEELVARAGDRAVHATSCAPYDGSTPYAAVRPLLDALLGTNHDRLSSHLDADALALLAIPLDLAASTTTAIDPARGAALIADAVAAAVAVVVDRPTILVLEDAHWCDEASATVLAAVDAAAADLPLLLVSSRRDAETGYRPPAARSLALAPLDEAASASLARAFAPQGRLLPDHARELVARGNGNPLFLRELAGSGGSAGELPDSIEELVEVRVDGLPARDRRLLRVAAVLGPSFRADLAERALGELVGDEVWARLSDFVSPAAADEYEFRHAILRETAYAGLPYRTRQRIHEDVGTLLEREGADPELLLVHFAACGDRTRTWRYGKEAGERAKQKFAFADAARFFRVAIDSSVDAGAPVDERAATYEALAHALGVSGQNDAALETARRALRSRALAAARGRFALQECQFLYSMGRYAEGERRARAALRLLPATDHRERVRVLVIRGAMANSRGDPKAALRHVGRAIDAARVAGDRAGEAHALMVRQIAESALRRPESVATGEAAVALLEATGDKFQLANTLNNLGSDLYVRGEWSRAVEYYRRAGVMLRELGDAISAAVVEYNEAEILGDQGRWVEAEERLRAATDALVAASHQYVPFSLSLLGLARGMQGELGEAGRLFDRAEQAFVAQGLAAYAEEVSLRRVQAGLASADAIDAIDLSARPDLVPRRELLRARARADAGDADGARAALVASAEAAAANGDRYGEALARQDAAVLAELGVVAAPVTLGAATTTT